MTSAETELIMAAGESSKTNLQDFMEKQRQMLKEFEGKNLPDNQVNDVNMHDEERTDSAENFHFKEDHFKNTLQDRSVNDGNKIITVQPGLSNGDCNYTNCNYQNTTQEYDDFVNIEKDDSETWIRKSKRQGKCEVHDTIQLFIQKSHLKNCTFILLRNIIMFALFLHTDHNTKQS